MSLHSLETCDLPIPLRPIACTRSSTRRVETPPIHASWITRDQRLLRDLPRFQERREVAPLPQLRNAQLQRSQPRVEHPVAPVCVAVAVAPGRSLPVALIASRTDQALDIGLHQQLQHRLRHGSQEIAVTGLLQQLGQRQSLLGHRILSRSWLKLRNSTLPIDPMATPAYTATPYRAPLPISTTSVDASEANNGN